MASSTLPFPRSGSLTIPPRSVPADASPSAIRLEGDIVAAQHGDAAAFGRLYDAQAPRLFAVCVGLTGRRDTAADLVQDVFVRAWEKLTSYRGDAAFSTWLHRIAVNLQLEQERARRRRVLRVASEGDLPEAPDTAIDAVVAPADATDRLDLEEAMARLPDGCRRVFVLHDIAGYAHAEIAAQLGIAEGTCKAHLFRARRLLRGMLDR